MKNDNENFLLEKIIKDNVSNLDSIWYEKKVKEFKKSVLYDPKEDCLIFKNTEIPYKLYNVYDKDDNLVGQNYIDGEETELEIRYDFKDFCLASNQFNLDGEYYSNPLQELEQIYGSLVSVYEKGLHDFSNDLILALLPIFDEVPASDIWKLIIFSEELLEKELAFLKEDANPIHHDLLTYYKMICSNKIYNSLQYKIEANRYCNLNNDTININLSLEELATLLVILDKTKKIELKPRFYNFLEKNITIGPPDKRKPIKASNFKSNISRVCSPDHYGKGIDKIKEILDTGVKIVMREIDQNMRLK
jgi:hypothetical protein